jgi:hypothetical protein
MSTGFAAGQGGFAATPTGFTGPATGPGGTSPTAMGRDVSAPTMGMAAGIGAPVGPGTVGAPAAPAQQAAYSVPGWFDSALTARESSGRANAVNSLGFAGLYQFGAPRMSHVGLYTPGRDENLAGWNRSSKDAAGKWSGTFNIPGFENVKTLQDFLANPAAQQAAFNAHVAQMDREIAHYGLEQHIGKTVGDVALTREGLYAMMHLGGAKGTADFLSGKKGDPADAYGTRMSSYAALGVPPPQQAASSPQSAAARIENYISPAPFSTQPAVPDAVMAAAGYPGFDRPAAPPAAASYAALAPVAPSFTMAPQLMSPLEIRTAPQPASVPPAQNPNTPSSQVPQAFDTNRAVAVPNAQGGVDFNIDLPPAASGGRSLPGTATVIDAVVGMIPGVGLLNAASSLLGGPSIGSFAAANPYTEAWDTSVDPTWGDGGGSVSDAVRDPQAQAVQAVERLEEKYLKLHVWGAPSGGGDRPTPYQRFVQNRDTYGRNV